ncbi:MAG: hypothetical protein KF823_01070 [Xanthomonadales bacterium]|nr:hypothetical protein [Xanthomonadales bacterium]
MAVVSNRKRIGVAARLRAVSLLLGSLLLAASAVEASELVVVSQRDLPQYWVPEGRTLAKLTVDGRFRIGYGCVALPVIIETSGSVKPAGGLLLWVRSPPPRCTVTADFFARIAASSLPTYRLAGDRRPDAAIYTALSVPAMDVALERRLGPERTSALIERLSQTCMIDDLAALHDEAGGRMVERLLPEDPETFLRQ